MGRAGHEFPGKCDSLHLSFVWFAEAPGTLLLHACEDGFLGSVRRATASEQGRFFFRHPAQPHRPPSNLTVLGTNGMRFLECKDSSMSSNVACLR